MDGTPSEKKLGFFSFASVPASILARIYSPTLLCTCLVMPILYVLLGKGKESMISLEEITSNNGPGENGQRQLS